MILLAFVFMAFCYRMNVIDGTEMIVLAILVGTDLIASTICAHK